jgi:UDP-N-acetylmuramate-alanine ligase
MVFLDLPEVREATNHFVKNMASYGEVVCFVDGDTLIDDKNMIYFVFVGL